MYNPKHYEKAQATLSFQPIDICRELPFSLGNAIKYILRASYKGNFVGDINKAIDYLRDYSNAHFYFARGNDFSPNFKLALEAYCNKNRALAILFNNPFHNENHLKTCIYHDADQDNHEHLASAYVFCCDAPSIRIDKESVQKTIQILKQDIKNWEELKNEIKSLGKELEKLKKDKSFGDWLNSDDDNNDDE